MNISVIIPCYNHEATLKRAVESALKQEITTEIIIVDDCSNDESFSVALELTRIDARIKALKTAVNMGLGGARNLGGVHATGDFLCFLDADDELLPGFFGKSAELISHNSCLVSIKGDVVFFDPVKGYILPEYDQRYSSAVLSSACGLLLSTAIFRAIGGFSESKIFRGPRGGEDVAFMEALKHHVTEIVRMNYPAYKVWSCDGGHTDRFLAVTRLAGRGFEFPGYEFDSDDTILRSAISDYLESVVPRVYG